MSTVNVKKSSFSPTFGRKADNAFELRLESVPGFTRAEGTNPRTGRHWGYGKVTDTSGNSCWAGDGGGAYGVQVQLKDQAALVAFLEAHPGCSKAEGTKSPRVICCSVTSLNAALKAAGVAAEVVAGEPKAVAAEAVTTPAVDEAALFAAFKAFMAAQQK